MSKNIEGIILSGLGGLYAVKADSGEVFPCRAKGAFRKAKMTPLVGDRVSIRPPEVAGEEYFMEEIFPRKNALIRPAMANLETLFVTFAPKNPEPSTLYLDKLLSIAVYNHIKPVIVITKQDISPKLAEKYADIYRKTGHEVFLCSSEDGAESQSLRITFARSRASAPSRVLPVWENPRSSMRFSPRFPWIQASFPKRSRAVNTPQEASRSIPCAS